MTETYKYKSKIATAVSFIAAFIVYLGEPGLKQIIPAEYAFYIPILVLLAGYFLSQSTENKRVEVAEQMLYEKFDEGSPDPAADYEDLNDEYNIPAEDEEDDI